MNQEDVLHDLNDDAGPISEGRSASISRTKDDIINDHPKLYKKIKYLETPNGWNNFLYGVSGVLECYCNDELYATQVKEKSNGLRIYLSISPPENIRRILSICDSAASDLCQSCGCVNELMYNYYPYCKKCIEEIRKINPNFCK